MYGDTARKRVSTVGIAYCVKLPLSTCPIRKLAYDKPVLARATYFGEALVEGVMPAVSVTALAKVRGVDPPVADNTL